MVCRVVALIDLFRVTAHTWRTVIDFYGVLSLKPLFHVTNKSDIAYVA